MVEKEFDIFGTNPIEIETYNKEKRKDSIIYAPKAKDAPDGVYEAKIRFLYNPVNPTKSIIHKVVYYLTDAEGCGYTFDSPQSIGDWNGCEIAQLWRKLSKSESAIDRKNAQKLQRRDVFYSLVYIIDDKIKPVYNGKIMVMKYGVKLKAKLDRYLNHKSGKRIDVFNFFNGRNMDLYITRQGNFNNYDETTFEEFSSPIVINGIPVQPNEEGREILRKFMSNAPSLEQFEYKPMSDEEYANLQRILDQYRSPGKTISNLTDKTVENKLSIKNKNIVSTVTDEDVNSMDKLTDDDNLEDFLNNLGI